MSIILNNTKVTPPPPFSLNQLPICLTLNKPPEKEVKSQGNMTSPFFHSLNGGILERNALNKGLHVPYRCAPPAVRDV